MDLRVNCAEGVGQAERAGSAMQCVLGLGGVVECLRQVQYVVTRMYTRELYCESVCRIYYVYVKRCIYDERVREGERAAVRI